MVVLNRHLMRSCRRVSRSIKGMQAVVPHMEGRQLRRDQIMQSLCRGFAICEWGPSMYAA